MRTSETTNKIAEAMVKASAKIKHATKDAKNPHFRNDYATLESVIDETKAPLLENGIVVIQSVSGRNLTIRLQHSSGEFFEDSMELLIGKNDMQGLGSAITYGRRYTLAAMLNIAQTDDDGNAAAGNAKVKAPVKAAQKVPSKPSDEF